MQDLVFPDEDPKEQLEDPQEEEIKDPKESVIKKPASLPSSRRVDEVAQLLASLPPTCVGRPEGFRRG